MTRILVTGSSEGLGLMAARLLVEDGHEVTLHARNDERADDARDELPAAMDVVVGDLSSISGMRQVAEQADVLGKHHAVIHNAGVGYREPKRIVTADGLSHVFAINVLAPYLVTALMTRPDRLVFISSGMHRGGDPDLSDLQWQRRSWKGSQAYADSKLFDVVLAFAVARHWPDVLPNALEPGWVPTKMGVPNAPDDLSLAPITQVWLATSDDATAVVTGSYFYHQKSSETHSAASSLEVQEELLEACGEITGVELPQSESGVSMSLYARESTCPLRRLSDMPAFSTRFLTYSVPCGPHPIARQWLRRWA